MSLSLAVAHRMYPEWIQINYSIQIGYCQEVKQKKCYNLSGDYMKYQERIYNLRIDNDYTQEKIATVLKITKQTYGKYENGKLNMKIEDLIRLCEFYNISPEYILGFTNEMKGLPKK